MVAIVVWTRAAIKFNADAVFQQIRGVFRCGTFPVNHQLLFDRIRLGGSDQHGYQCAGAREEEKIKPNENHTSQREPSIVASYANQWVETTY